MSLLIEHSSPAASISQVPISDKPGSGGEVQPRLIDLFCGAGGLTLGFSQAGYRPVWANDIDVAAARTYETNFGAHCFVGDICKLIDENPEAIPQADLVAGGPPCQGFSLLNKGRVGDSRRQLWEQFLQIVGLSGARAFLMENVPQLLGTTEHEAILRRAGEMGFRTKSVKLLAADFGVPQTRTRAFIFGWQGQADCDSFPPTPTHRSPNSQLGLPGMDAVRPWRTVRDAIGDLEPPVGTEIRVSAGAPSDLHFGRNPTAKSLARYQAVPEQGMNREDLLRNAPELTPNCWLNKKGGTDLFGRMWWDRPSFTIRTEFFKPEKGRYLHPEQHRPITHREAARLQGFPDEFRFTGSKIQVARQIGNAVPPPLARAVALAIRAMVLEVAELGR